MKPKSKVLVGILVCLMLLLAGCKGAAETQAVPSPGEEAQTAATETLTPSPSPSPSPTPVLQIANAITRENAAQVQELWRIGNGQYEEVKWSHDSQYAVLGTGAGIFVLGREGEFLFSSLEGWVNDNQITFSHDGSMMAAGFSAPVWLEQGKQPNYIVIFSLPSGEVLNVIDFDLKYQVESISFQEDGSLVVFGNTLDEYYQTDRIFVTHFDSLTGERLYENQVQIIGYYAERLEVSDRGEDVLIQFYDNASIHFYNNSGYGFGSIPYQEYSRYVFNGGYFAFNPREDGKTIQVYKTNGVFLGSVEVETGCADCSVMGFFIDVDGKFLYVNDNNRHFLVYSLPGLEVQDEFDLPHSASLYSPDFTRGIKAENNEFFITDLETGDVLGVVPDILMPIETLAVSPDHSQLLLASTGYDRDRDYSTYAEVWNTSRMELERTITLQRDPDWGEELESITFLGDGNTLMVHKKSNAILEFWDIAAGNRIDTFEFSHEVNTAGASSDGNLVLGAARDLGLEIWNRQTEELLVDNENIYQYIGFYSPTFTPDDQTIIIGGSDTTMIWDLENLSNPVEMKGNGLLAVDPQGSVLALHLQNSLAMVLYDLDNRRVISEQEWGFGVNDMVFSSDGNLLIISSYDGIFLWDVDSGEIVHTIEYSPDNMALSNDGELLVTSSLDGTVRLWGIP